MTQKRRIVISLVVAAAISTLGARVAWAVPPTTYSPVIEAPCWLNKTEVGASGYNEVIVGDLRGMITSAGSPTGTADAYYDGGAGDCGSADAVAADFPPNTKMWIRINTGFAIDASSTAAGSAYFKFEIDEYDSTNCTGTNTWSPDPVEKTITFPASYDWAEIDPWGDFHFERNSPGASRTRSYFYNILVTTTVTGGGSPFSTNETGCFRVGTSG